MNEVIQTLINWCTERLPIFPPTKVYKTNILHILYLYQHLLHYIPLFKFTLICISRDGTIKKSHLSVLI